jgi:hypothetical protein
MAIEANLYHFWQWCEIMYKVAYSGNKTQINRYAKQSAELYPEERFKVTLGENKVIFEGDGKQFKGL